MSGTEGQEEDARLLHADLSALPGVRRVDLTEFPAKLTAGIDAAGVRALAVEAIRAMAVARTGEDPVVNIESVGGSTPGVRRARFESVDLTYARPGIIRARAVLEWQRERYDGVVEAETTATGELRACALATLRAVEKVTGEKLTFTLMGVRELRVFDHDLIAVLVHCPMLPSHRLIGTSIIVDNRRRSAALAALSATNRAVGISTEKPPG